jgi:hypothetical protein
VNLLSRAAYVTELSSETALSNYAETYLGMINVFSYLSFFLTAFFSGGGGESQRRMSNNNVEADGSGERW